MEYFNIINEFYLEYIGIFEPIIYAILILILAILVLYVSWRTTDKHNPKNTLNKISILELLTELRLEVNSEKAYILHVNSKVDKTSNVQDIELICKYQSIKEGYTPVLLIDNKELNKKTSDVLKKLSTSCVVLYIEKLDDNFLKSLFLRQGVKTLVLCPIFNKDDTYYGAVCINFLHVDNFDPAYEKEIFNKVKDFTDKIAYEVFR